MRGDPDRHDDLDDSSRGSGGYEADRGKSFTPAETYLFRKSPLTIRTHTPPGRSDSPTVYPPSPPPTSSSMPLLTATLNAPVAYYSNVRVKSDSPATRKCEGGGDKQTAEVSNSLSSPQSAFYSTLIHQLRQKTTGETVKIQAAIKLRKSDKTAINKPLPFVCPACRKRFQRHIAMNAHFQNEHISPPASGPGERTCKLCSSVSPSLAAVRQHLRVVHNIDLDNPTKCMEAEVTVRPVAKYSVLEASLRSGLQEEMEPPSCSNIEMSSGRSTPVSCVSVSPAHTPTSSESPERSLFPLHQDGHRMVVEDDDPQVEDLSIRKPSPVSPQLRRGGSFSPRSESPTSKRLKRACSPSPPTAATGYTCVHCNIVYPNQTLYFLHRGFHSESNPWRCNSCGSIYSDLYAFNTHLFSVAHQ